MKAKAVEKGIIISREMERDGEREIQRKIERTNNSIMKKD